MAIVQGYSKVTGPAPRPRIVSGAHCFSGVYAGSLPLTPASDFPAAGIAKRLPAKLYPTTEETGR